MPPVEVLLSWLDYLPPAVAVSAVVLWLAIRWRGQSHETDEQSKRSEWDRMRDLLHDVERQRDERDRLAASLTEDNVRLREENERLRHELVEAARHIDHRKEQT